MEQVNNIEQYLRLLERYNTYYDKIFFRGQSAKYTTMPPSIARDAGYLENEGNIFNEAINMKNDEFRDLKYPIEKLSKLQHYGIPTRLIDITVDPLIALFFAVQNTNSEYAGNIYVYISNGCNFDDEKVKALSFLATQQDYDLKRICTAYEKQYGSFITEEQFLSLIGQPVFLKHCEELRESNSRLYNQKGTFVICSNLIEGNKITHMLVSLDRIKPSMIIQIPYEYKALIKEELDQVYGINELQIYPELPSVADYIKGKYKKDNFSSDGTYSLMKTRDISNLGIKRISLIVVLKVLLTINQIRKVLHDLIDEYKSSYDVVWVYIAKNGDDYIMSNWIIRGQWINPKLDKKYTPIPLKNDDGCGYYWEGSQSYSTLNDYYSKYVFDDDKVLYIYNQKIYDEILPIYKSLFTANEDKNLDDFIEILNKHKDFIRHVYLQFGDFGHSRNKEFDDFLENYQYFISALDDLQLWVAKDNLNRKSLLYQINSCLTNAKKYNDIIEEKSRYWREFFSVSEDDYARIDPYNRQKHEYQYEQTIPISADAIIVSFETKVCENQDCTFKIVGTTNLFDHAELMLSVKDIDGKLLGQSKSSVLKGYFEFERMSINGEGYIPGMYKGNISLSIPDVQPKDFIKKAGIEYENLTGSFIDRTGIGPAGNYCFEFEIE